MFKWLLFLIIYLPFQIALNPADDIDLASVRAFILLLFSIWLINVIAKDVSLKRNIPWQSRVRIFSAGLLRFARNDLQSISLLLFLLISGLSVLTAENHWWALRKWLFFASVFPLYFLTRTLVSDGQKMKKVILAIVGSAGIFALIGLGQLAAFFVFGLDKVYLFWTNNIVPVFSGENFGALILTYPSWLVNVNGQVILRAFSLFSDPHMFAFYLGLVLPLGIVFGSLTPKFFRGIILLLLLFLFIGLLLSFTRGAYLAIIVTFLISAGLFWQYLKEKKIAVFLCLSLLIFIIPGTPVSERLFSTFDLEEGSNVGRLDMWQQAGQLGLKNPWQGVGLGNYSLMVEPGLGYRNPMTAHNLYLDIFSELGFFGLAVWLVLILGTIGQLWRKLKKNSFENQEQKYILIGLFGSLVYFSIHSFFETAVYNPSVLAFLMVVLGLVTNINASKNY